MKISPNYQMSMLLGISHLITDAIASFTLTSLSLGSLVGNGQLILSTSFVGEVTFYFFLYNGFAFFAQFFVAYFYDRISNEEQFFQTSRNTLFISFFLYFIGLITFSFVPLIGILLVAFGSCFFHISAGNIALVSEKEKASHIGIFASGGVTGLAVGSILAFYLYEGLVFLSLGLLVVSFLLFKQRKYILGKEKDFKISEGNLKQTFIVSILFLGGILILRSSLWTYIHTLYSIDMKLVLTIAIFASLGKMIGGILWDKLRSDKWFFFISIWSIGGILFAFYLTFLQTFLLIPLIVFSIQTSIAPITIILASLLPKMKSQIIGYTFGLSLVFGYWIMAIFT